MGEEAGREGGREGIENCDQGIDTYDGKREE